MGVQEGKLLERERIGGRRDATRVRMGVVDRSEVTAVPLVRNVVDRCIRRSS
jgi:hypothetical protein